MKRLILGLSILMLIAIAGFVIAQDEAPAPACDAAAATEDLGALVSGLTEAGDLSVALRGLQGRVSDYVIACGGLTFDSETAGMMPVVGPFDIPTGVYRVTAKTEGYMIAKIEGLEGECGDYNIGSLFSISKGQASEGAQMVFNTESCRGLLTISNVTEPWTLTFELIQ